MPLFDFIQDVGDKFESARQKKIDEARAAKLEAEAARTAAEAEQIAADTAQIAADTAQMEAEYDALMLDALNDHVAALGLSNDDVQIEFAQGIVTLRGAAPDADTRDKVILAVGNVYGVEQVDDQIEVPEADPPRFYTVAKGDTLSKISAHFYGKGRYYRTIFEANKPLLKDPNKIYVGQVLRIPAEPE